METVEMRVVARARSGFPAKFGIPRQSGLVEALRAQIVFEPEFRSPEALRGLEGFSHLWLLWEFSANRRESWSPTVRPPRLGGNQRVGVFASRSPFRPSPIGMSCVTLEGIDLYTPEGPVLTVGGGDLLDGTPILDMTELDQFVRAHRPDVAVLTVPQAAAQATANRLIDLGVRGFWNFTNVELSSDDPGVRFEDVHFADSLLTLSYRITER